MIKSRNLYLSGLTFGFMKNEKAVGQNFWKVYNIPGFFHFSFETHLLFIVHVVGGHWKCNILEIFNAKWKTRYSYSDTNTSTAVDNNGSLRNRGSARYPEEVNASCLASRAFHELSATQIEKIILCSLNPNQYYMYPMVKHCIQYFQAPWESCVLIENTLCIPMRVVNGDWNRTVSLNNR